MTREDIENMEAGREMDWHIQEKVINEPLGRFDSYPKPYSTDISAAWEVVEKIKNGDIQARERFETIIQGWLGHLWIVTELTPEIICRAALLAASPYPVRVG